MSLELPFGVRVLNQTPADDKYLNNGVAYTDVNEVNSLLPIGIRHIGLTVNINNVEYWYGTGIADLDLIEKSLGGGGTITGATNLGSGIGVYSGTSSGLINLRGLVGSGGTNISLSGDSIIINSTQELNLNGNILNYNSFGKTFEPYSGSQPFLSFYTGGTEPTGNTRLNLNGNLGVNEIIFSTGSTHDTHEVGHLFWDKNDKTLSLKTTNDVTQQIGQELVIHSVNNGGSTIFNGSVVYIDGSFGGKPSISLARAGYNDGDIVKAVIGFTTEDISAGNEGFVTASGLVRGINTSTFVEGEIIYLSTTTYGGITNIKPIFPDFSIEVGVVTKVGITDGSIYVNVIDSTVNKTIRGVEEANTTNFTATTRSDFIAAYATRNIFLPTTPELGQQITIADSNGDASIFDITIYGNGNNISGVDYLTPESDATINSDWGAITLSFNGTFWNIISFSI